MNGVGDSVGLLCAEGTGENSLNNAFGVLEGFGMSVDAVVRQHMYDVMSTVDKTVGSSEFWRVLRGKPYLHSIACSLLRNS